MLSYSKPQIYNSFEFLNILRMITQSLIDDILFGIPYLYKDPIIQLFIVCK